jgi:hypothetical protein
MQNLILLRNQTIETGKKASLHVKRGFAFACYCCSVTPLYCCSVTPPPLGMLYDS